MSLSFRLIFILIIFFAIASCKRAYDIEPKDLRLAQSGKLDRTKYAVVVAGGRFYAHHFLWGSVQRPLTGNFYKAPYKPGSDRAATRIIDGSQYVNGIHRVTLLPAGTWEMHRWISLKANSYGYNTISSKITKPSGLARFTVKPGDVIYIGELTIRTDKEGATPISIKNDMEKARSALANEYPKLVKKLIYHPMKLTP